MLLAACAVARLRRWRSAPTISTIWRLRETRSASAWVSALGRGRTAGLVAATKRAMTAASIGSVLARLPSAVAKARTCAGLTTITGRPVPASPAATIGSNPPVASTATARQPSGPSRSANAARPLPSRGTAKAVPAGKTCTSSRSFDTSIPTITVASILTHPCASGLATRPKRLFGFDGTAGEGSRSPTGLMSQGHVGLPSATAPIAHPATNELQGQGRNALDCPHPSVALRLLPPSPNGRGISRPPA